MSSLACPLSSSVVSIGDNVSCADLSCHPAPTQLKNVPDGRPSPAGHYLASSRLNINRLSAARSVPAGCGGRNCSLIQYGAGAADRGRVTYQVCRPAARGTSRPRPGRGQVTEPGHSLGRLSVRGAPDGKHDQMGAVAEHRRI